MSQETWLFIFALCGGLGGVAAFFDLLWKLMRTDSAHGPLTISRGRAWFTGSLLLGSLLLSGFGFWTIHARSIPPQIPKIIEWGGLTGPSGHFVGCQVVVDTMNIISLADKYDVVLVCGVTDPTIDPLQDSRIAVSQPFTITGGQQSIADVFRNPDLEAVFASGEKGISVWNRIVVIPKGIDLSKIHTLSDVPGLGGKLFP